MLKFGKYSLDFLTRALAVKLAVPDHVDSEPPREPVPEHQVVNPCQGEVVTNHKLDWEGWSRWCHWGACWLRWCISYTCKAAPPGLDDVSGDPWPEYCVLHPVDHTGHALVGSVDCLKHLLSQLDRDDDPVLVAHQLLGHLQVMLELDG